MTARTSISRMTVRRQTSRSVRLLAVMVSVTALALLSIGILSFSQANRLMRLPPAPLDTFSSNILPPFNLASFPSLNEQTMLSGWYFPTPAEPVSTIILVHGQGKNRLQFGLDSARLYQFLLDRGFCVLAFDLRNSGESGGEMSTYGYAEWSDVLAAIRYVRKNAATRDVLLFGFGSGSAAVLLALDHLPPAGTVSAAASGDAAALKLLENYPKPIRNMGLDQAYVRGLLLDTPCDSPDEYIRAACRQEGWLGEKILQYTVPYAVRLSSGNGNSSSLTTILTRSQLPVFLTYSRQVQFVRQSAVASLVSERQRLHPDTTMILASEPAGYASGFLDDRTAWLDAVQSFLARFFPAG